MFTKEDFLHYFDQVLAIEREMHETYKNLQNGVQHPYYKKAFAKLAKEEKDHEALLEDLKERFKTDTL